MGSSRFMISISGNGRSWLGWLLVLLASGAIADPELDYGLETNPLAGVEITGNTLPSDDLKRALRLSDRDWLRPLASPEYRPDLIETQLRQLRSYYRRQGYHEATATLDSVVTRSEYGDVLYISVDEGSRTLIDEVRFLGTGPIDEGDLRRVLELTEGSPSPADLNGFGEDIYRMRRLYWDEARLRAEIRPALSFTPTKNDRRRLATVTYVIEPGPTYTVSRIDITGTPATREELIVREVRLDPGDPFAWDAVELTRQQLLATALFRDVSLRAVDWDTTAHTAALEVRVTDRKPAYYELGIGLGSRERVRALAAWGHNNLWGSGRRLQLRLRGYWNVEEIIADSRNFDEGDLNYRADVFYSNPHLFGREYPLDVNLFGKRETRG
ncbi:hypothetical protein GF314_04035, partial [bacterium]|nr:hypothetical protein [bacterium]